MSERVQGRAWVVGISIAAVLAVVLAGGLWLKRERRDVSGSQTEASAGSTLLADIQRYRKNSRELEPGQAVSQWFALYDRASGMDREPCPDCFDIVIGDQVGEESLVATLPPPSGWPAFRGEAERRAAADSNRRTLGLRYLSELLMGDRSAALATVAALSENDKDADVRPARALLSRLYGDANAQIAAFEVETGLPADEYDFLPVPDLVALAGERRAEALLVRAVESSRVLSLQASEPTAKLARRVALAHVKQMKHPQWSLANSVDAPELYEAMSKRFPESKEDEDTPETWGRREAATYYFLAMVLRGRHGPAEQALVSLANAGDPVSIPHAAVEALQRAQANAPLFSFLDALLQRRPEVRAWSLYIEQAAFTGNSKVALERIEAVLARKNLPAAVRVELQSWRFGALLAADQIAAAENAATELLASDVKATAAEAQTRLDAASRAALAGRLLGNDKLLRAGLAYLQNNLKRSPESAAEKIRATLYGELRQLGRPDEALALARAVSESKPGSFSEAVAHRMGQDSEGVRAALVEMAGIQSAAGRHAEVLELLSDSSRWAARDLAEILDTLDSQGVPMGVIAARALAATGDKDRALRVARATVAALPGKDAGYELIAALDPDPASTFDQMFEGDPYEERPLIWKASVQFAKGEIGDAESTIRRAIAIDPSDGEEGPNDRMRAYAVLAQILQKQAKMDDARLYSNAVAAIRLSEHGDQLHKAGLYDRAFKTYREALEKFSDAYCIQSRLAVQLNKQGRRKEALVHYRRAYELMPSSFGRVESHCFGCESVFVGSESQSIAEQVFTDVIRKSPDKPQAYYLLAYLRDQQGRYEDALQPLRSAVSLDPQYLNAWKRLDSIARYTFIEAGERDIVKLKLLELDPMRRHAHYEVSEVGDLRGLWLAADRAHALRIARAPSTDLLRLEASAKLRDAHEAGLSPDMRQFDIFMERFEDAPSAATTLHQHVLVANAVELMGLSKASDYGFVE